MKLLLPLLFFSVVGLAQKPLDIIHYTYNVSVADTNDIVNCHAIISFQPGAKIISLDLANTMRVSSVLNLNNQVLKYRHTGNKLSIELQHTSDTIIFILYSGVPADGLIISKNKFGQRTFFSDHWPNRAHEWLVCNDHPSDKASIEFSVSAPIRYQVISNGIQIEETNTARGYKITRWKETSAIPMKVVCIGISEFAVQYIGSTNNIPVFTWVFPSNKKEGFDDYREAIEILPYFIKNIGPYPYAQLSNIQSKTIFGGMENAGAIFYSEKSVTGNKRVGKLIAHEVAHQWFGNSITEADWPHFWLSEGFATYMELMYLESKYGPDTLVKELTNNRNDVIAFSKTTKTPVVDTTIKDYMKLINANSYEKGGWILHMLRRQLGDTMFWNGIRKYYAIHAGNNVVTHDFRKVMEQISGRNLELFFKQWLFTAGHPVLKIDHVYDEVKKTVSVTITQQQSALFEFPLTLRITNINNKVITRSLDIKSKQTRFSVSIEAPLQGIIADPACNLLFEQVK